MTAPLLFARNADGLLFKSAASNTVEKDEVIVYMSSQDQNIKTVGLEEFPIDSTVEKIAALIGFIKLKLNRYAVVAKRVESTGQINGHHVYKVVEHSIIAARQNARIDSDESEYLKLLESHLSTATLFFSYTYDLTNSFQRNEHIQSKSWRTTDSRFFWNHYLTDDLQALANDDARVDSFIQPFIYGYAKSVDTVFNSQPISLGLITRRSRFRAGTRYFRRGIDADGNTANFNETEQILIVKGEKAHLFSFLQTRGSVPVFWAEINNLKYKPSLVLGDNSSLEPTKKHFEEQEKLYGENYLVNLVNQKGHELPVKEAYEAAVDGLDDPKLHYMYFDFHHECRNMQWDRVHLLIDRLKNAGLTDTDFFHKIMNADGSTEQVVNQQSSAVRTNCMDCLDRTNVVQSVLASWVLQKEFDTANLIANDQKWQQDKQLLLSFQNLWADNADAVSVAYSGTGALKTDFTRTGLRTRKGAFQDFVNSASRYYQNNLTDGPRQDAFDLFLGNFRPSMALVQSPFPDRRPVYIQFVPSVILAASTVLVAAIFFPKEQFTSSKNLMFFFGALVTLAMAFHFLMKNGIQFVNWPKLVDVGFLVVKQTHDKEQQFKGLKYVLSSKYSKPRTKKND